MPRNNQGNMGGQGRSLTPNEKYNAEFAESDTPNQVAQKARASHAEGQTHTNFQTPDEKFNAEFAVENESNKLGSLANNSVNSSRQSRSRRNS
ncbi:MULTISPECIES: hypothetical protein [Paenibacillus]|uniref:hypothetical protein n=1 Tax=Paenibacillus TaxID=44249 RepID=UPI000839066D|nr:MULTISPECIES: hypothetical protein [Paenibacillus]GIP24160.1 hypothetical protein J22TS3_44350 [Paenibacillus sp. J22TS3]